jgi:hypothetical protein
MLTIQLREQLQNIINENTSFSAEQLPDQVKAILINKLYPKHYGKKRGIIRNKPYTVSDIKTTNRNAHQMVQSPKDKKWSALNINVIRKLKLVGIYSYGNGDYAWYSLANGRVYDMNHDIGDFSGFLSKENIKYKNQLWPPMPFNQWVSSVLSGKHIDAWNNRK